jgi:tetratricopeptide (TPR) repeat protein
VKKLYLVFGFVVLALVVSAALAKWRERGQEALIQSERQSPYRPPRVFGQAWLDEEADSWNRFLTTVSPRERIQSGLRFLDRYPSSGLTSFVHREVALSYYQIGDDENFVSHSELALAELNHDVVILSTLARVHAERGDSEAARGRVREGRAALLVSEKGLGFPLDQWTFQINQARADLDFAEATGLLSAAGRTDDAVALLENAIGLDPDFGSAHLMLGSAEVKRGDLASAIESYARAASVGGSVSESAREQLVRIFEQAGKNTGDVEGVIQVQAVRIETSLARNEAEVQRLMARVSSAWPSVTGCPSWDDLMEEESVTRLEQGNQARLRLAMSFVYLNPRHLGACVLGAARYQASRGDLYGKPNRHLFWVGLGGDSIEEFDAGSIYMVQGNKRFDISSRAWTRGDRTFPDIQAAAIVSFEGEMDFTEPVTIFYTSGAVAYSNEYWLPARYFPGSN